MSITTLKNNTYSLFIDVEHEQYVVKNTSQQVLKTLSDRAADALNALVQQSQLANHNVPAIAEQLTQVVLQDIPFPAEMQTLSIHLPQHTNLHILPWEALPTFGKHPQLSEAIAVFRLSSGGVRRLAIPSAPIRMLLTTVSSPDCPPEKNREEERLLREIEAASQGRIHLTVLRDVSRLRLLREWTAAVQGGIPFHIWHHSGAARMTQDEIVLHFSDVESPISALAGTLNQNLELRLGVLSLSTPSGGYPQRVDTLKLPALVMVRAVENPDAGVIFSNIFYHELWENGLSKAMVRACQQVRLAGLPHGQDWLNITTHVQTTDDRLLERQTPAILHDLPVQRDQIFISYSHADRAWFEQLVGYMDTLRDRIKFWSDKDIAVGRDWFREITAALQSAKVAIVLASPRFFNSKFIREHEFPAILKAYRDGELTIIWVALSAHVYEMTELAPIQSVHPPNQPLDRLSSDDVEDIMLNIVREAYQLLNQS